MCRWLLVEFAQACSTRRPRTVKICQTWLGSCVEAHVADAGLVKNILSRKEVVHAARISHCFAEMVPFLNGKYFGLGPKVVLLLSKFNLTLVRVHVRTFGCVDQQSVSCPIIVSHWCVVMLPLLYTDTHSLIRTGPINGSLTQDFTVFPGQRQLEMEKNLTIMQSCFFKKLFWCVLRTIIILIVEQDGYCGGIW